MNRFLTITLMFVCSLMMGAQTNVDTRIAVNDARDENTFVVIISNEEYKHEEPVPFAKNDGEVFKIYCQKTLGIPDSHISFVPNATLNEMSYEIDHLAEVLDAYDGTARAIVYYTGHGMPDESTREAYLLPVDGYSQKPTSGMSTKELYEKLGKMNSKSIMVFLDACFSGARRDGKMLASSRGVALKTSSDPVGDNTVVFSAAQGDETAYPFKSQNHGMFTYFILDKMQQSGGHTTLGELSDYVTQKVKRKSVVENKKSQTPSILASSGNPGWRNWMFAQKQAKKYESRRATTVQKENEKPVVHPQEPSVQTVTAVQVHSVQPGGNTAAQESDVATLVFERKLRSADLDGLSKKDLEILRNMIYARHGYRFKRTDLMDHFSKFSWYKPYTGDANEVVWHMSDIERYNVDFIKRHEK